ncbi:MAG: 16S rRNA (cytosine(1402)-N(4))-methyltransferase RsmH [Candidatus Pacebacteria bacterium]|nr:16S rRNA (cytosine(1402)-N(4))-methyltransferase RsmH [Candidatus Paceibacterota bacterium]
MLVQEVVRMLAPKKGEVVVDATAGQGGHSEALLKEAQVRLIALDADPTAVEAVQTRLKRFGERVEVINSNFSKIADVLTDSGVQEVDAVLFDLGWRQEQLAQGRGFSFQQDEPLIMSYGDIPASGFTAAEALNQWSEKALADVLFGYGEERYARRIAKAIVERREVKPIETTVEFVEIIRDSVPSHYRHGKLHFATRSFQALRIAVNDELSVIDKGVRGAWKHLAPGGRIAVISFHSTEDRVVKRLFQALAKENGTLLTKKPIVATKEELTHNPSSRSAKLRGIQKDQ